MKTFTIKQLEWKKECEDTYKAKLGLGYIADVWDYNNDNSEWRFAIDFEDDCFYQLFSFAQSEKYDTPSEAMKACEKKWHEILLSILEEVKEN